MRAELALHAGYAARWGADLAAGLEPLPATREYVAFLEEVTAECAALAAAQPAPAESPEPASASVADSAAAADAAAAAGVATILAAMVPCLRLYGWLACELAEAFSCARPPACLGAEAEARGGAEGGGSGGAEEQEGGAAGGGNPYWEWMATYSAPEYLRLPAAAEAALDAAAAAAAGGIDAGESRVAGRGGVGAWAGGGWLGGWRRCVLLCLRVV